MEELNSLQRVVLFGVTNYLAEMDYKPKLVLVEHDDAEFEIIPEGTTLSLYFRKDEIDVTDFGLVTQEDSVIKTFENSKLKDAVECLVTRANLPS